MNARPLNHFIQHLHIYVITIWLIANYYNDEIVVDKQSEFFLNLTIRKSVNFKYEEET